MIRQERQVSAKENSEVQNRDYAMVSCTYTLQGISRVPAIALIIAGKLQPQKRSSTQQSKEEKS